MRFVLATANPDKATEIAAILDGVELVPRPAGVPDVDETADTLHGNALLKARALVDATGEAAVADDTGLEVMALDGAPGVRTARFAGERATYADNVAKLLRELKGASDRRARFRTVAAACFPDGRELVAEGSVDGVIADAPRGTSGFGYDPVFVPDAGDGRTFAEMSDLEKHDVSHRGRAFRALAAQLSDGRDVTALFYDDHCRFCRACAAFVARVDRPGRLAVLPFSDRDADRRLGTLGPEERAASMHLVRADGTVLSAGAALTEMLRGTSGLGWLGRGARRLRFVQTAIDRVYWAVANNRSRIGRFVPDVEPVVRRGARP